jgi:hypothetical protein
MVISHRRGPVEPTVVFEDEANLKNRTGRDIFTLASG